MKEFCGTVAIDCTYFADLFDESDKFNKDGFIESEAFVAAIKDVAEQIGYDIQESVIGKAKSRRFNSFFSISYSAICVCVLPLASYSVILLIAFLS